MDFLTHVFVPLTIVYVLREELFTSPAVLGIAGFGLVSDFDKFLGMPGLLHSLVTMIPLCGGLIAAEYRLQGCLKWTPIVAALILSHLALDVLDGGPVTLLYPFVDTGIGFQYPVRTVFGQGPLGLTFDGPLVTLRTETTRTGYNTYGFIKGTGVASALTFVIIYLGNGGSTVPDAGEA